MVTYRWHSTSNTLAFLAVKDEKALGVLLRKAKDRGIPMSPFYEPDRNNELTAIAFGPEGRAITKGLPLALQGP